MDIIRLNDKEFVLLPENSPKLHFVADEDTIGKWKSAIFEKYNFDYLHQNVPNLRDFKPFKVIGEGHSGKVLLVRRKSDEKLFALKLIEKERLFRSSSIQRSITERNILIHTKFPFITKIYSAFQTDSHLVLALEYVGGGDLQHHLDRNINFSRNQIKIYLAQLVLTLEHLHNMGIVFRDLKPSNILIDKDGNLKIADFGLAKSLIETGRAKTLCGTHDYLAPEMVDNIPYDFSVDIWAFGVIAYRLICGALPFNSNNLCRLYDRISSCDYRIPFRIDEASRGLISGLLKKSPSERLNLTQIKNHEYFSDIDWQKVYKKEYKLDFVPYRADDDSAHNFDTYLFEKYRLENYENEYEASDSCSMSSSNSNFDIFSENNNSFFKDFSFSSGAENFDDDL